MRMYDLILKKREGRELTTAEINYFISGYNCGQIPDYQAAALLMAIFFRGLNERETAELTMAICDSGDRADLSGIPGIKVDKHSTGGVGDKTTLVLVPLVAAAGVPVAKMSGRGLGHTGGTVDKLESIPGFNVTLQPAQFIEQVRGVGAAVVAQTGNLAPADKKLYALRDVTATVESVPLIASSVMSKKIAAGADAIVLDVKVGSGAFMKDTAGAFKLARTMVEIGSQVGRRTVALITDMDQPLGRAVGNALEVKEAIDTLKGAGPPDLLELCLVLGSTMLLLAGKSASLEEGRSQLKNLLASGKALEKFEELISAQGGDPLVTSEFSRLPAAKSVQEIPAPLSGYVQSINAAEVGHSAMLLGAGREKKEAQIDLSVGLVLNKKVGDSVQAGESLATIHANNLGQLDVARETILQAYTIGQKKPEPRPLLIGTVPERI
ncbi:pyrimidine-nucleoside phosphorylase [Pelotomaculum propionicicum]|uniref:Pyrimidine-nucleoside phosphorylase n=1 Tax=Pelotomaculum propionicicum TaxID=258475 RepID=A0A4Y7RMG9_9FIRM|nr:pyrimidine-nucleoside phosphorylase [Pelotomaculum propionicicum]NLI12374.1 pyrimidine-nucleoside phosphorylase [Peptococcaceae bacterium]TEB10063.1 Pyrimidine-nucleoside phosphorylase [Pelotomaculum propionicicum]